MFLILWPQGSGMVPLPPKDNRAAVARRPQDAERLAGHGWGLCRHHRGRLQQGIAKVHQKSVKRRNCQI